MDFQIEDIEDSKPNLSNLETKPNNLNCQTKPEVCDNSCKAPMKIEASTSRNHSIEFKIINREENIDKVDRIEAPFKVEELEIDDNSWKAPMKIEASTSQNHSIEFKIIEQEENIDKVDQIEVPFKVEELKIENNIFLEQMSSVHEEKQYNCKLCDKSFNKPEHLSEHVITVHVSCDICDKIKIFPHEICHFMCNFCGAIFTDPDRHFDHVKSNICRVCNFCDTLFTSSESLNEHIKSEICRNKHIKNNCRTKDQKDNNKRVHEGGNLWKCGKCEESFSEADELVFHVECVHEGKNKDIVSSRINNRGFKKDAINKQSEFVNQGAKRSKMNIEEKSKESNDIEVIELNS